MTVTLKKSLAWTKNKRLKSQIILFVGIAILFIILNFSLGGKFLSKENIVSTITHSIYITFVGWGMSFIFTSGLVDLSIGATIVLSANVGAVCAMELGMGYFGLIVPTILCAIVCELISVNCTVSLKIPSWISGLGMALIYEAILAIYGTARSITKGSNTVALTDYRLFGTMPAIFIVWVVGFIVAYFLFNRTTIGINICALGNNDNVAQIMGINKKKTMLFGAVIGSIFIGVSAIIQLSYSVNIYPRSGLSSLSGIFKPLAAVLLAQSFGKIINIPFGVMLGAVIISGIFNVLTLFGVPSGTGQEIFLGVIVILCGIISHWKSREVEK